ncbi:Hypothetical predicted protein, partial [Paramuricea clavata]
TRLELWLKDKGGGRRMQICCYDASTSAERVAKGPCLCIPLNVILYNIVYCWSVLTTDLNAHRRVYPTRNTPGRADRTETNKGYGGVAIYVREGLPFQIDFDFLPVWKTSTHHRRNSCDGNHSCCLPVNFLTYGSALNKIMEKVVRSQFYKFLNSQDPLSTLSNSADEVLLNMEQGNLCGAVFLDLTKAFDTVDHCILCLNYRQLGFRPVLSNVTVSVPQGSILDPRLLEDKLNEDFLRVAHWLRENKFTLNLDKTKSMIIGSNRQLGNVSSLSLSIFDTDINTVSSFKYLGVMLSTNFTWTDHIEYISSKINKNLGLLRRIKHLLPHRARLLFYNSLVLPIFDYVDLVWGDKDNPVLLGELQEFQSLHSYLEIHSHNTRNKDTIRLPKIKRNWGKQRTNYQPIKDCNDLDTCLEHRPLRKSLLKNNRNASRSSDPPSCSTPNKSIALRSKHSINGSVLSRYSTNNFIADNADSARRTPHTDTETIVCRSALECPHRIVIALADMVTIAYLKEERANYEDYGYFTAMNTTKKKLLTGQKRIVCKSFSSGYSWINSSANAGNLDAIVLRVAEKNWFKSKFRSYSRFHLYSQLCGSNADKTLASLIVSCR